MWVVIRAKQLLVKQLEKDLRSFNRSKASMSRKIKAVNGKIKKVKVLLKGRRTTSFSPAWSAYLWFEAEVAMNASELLAKQKVKASARKASNFFSNKKNDTREIEAAPNDAVYAGQLADWLRQKKYMVKSSSPAYFAITGLFTAINQHAQNQRKELEQRIEKIRDQTFKTWDTSFILGLGLSAAKKIEEAK